MEFAEAELKQPPEVRQFRMLINGRLVDGDAHMGVTNPSTEGLVATCPRASVSQLNQAVAAAKSAFPAWSRTAVADRRSAINRMADRIEANRDALARVLTMEQGKPFDQAQFEIDWTLMHFRYFAGLELPDTAILEDTSERRIEQRHVPLGVVAAIVPWNFPLVSLSWKLPPALLAGNTIVFKPAPTTALTTLMLAELFADLVPAGVVNIIADDNDLGDKLTAHPDVDKITFTGSTATGKKVLANAASDIKRVTLELGGNDAGIVLDDVDPREIAQKLFDVGFYNNGQVCGALKRLYVHESIYDAVCDELAKIADAAIVGDGFQQGTQFGPIQNKKQYDRVRELLEDARQHGKVIAGGTYPSDKGYFIRPTIVRDISDGTRLVDEEQFGPVMPVIKFSDVDDVIDRANKSPYGLGGSVWSKDTDRALELALRLQSGTVWVNQHLSVFPHIPFGGMKQSGLGCDLGPDGLLEFTHPKIVNIAK